MLLVRGCDAQRCSIYFGLLDELNIPQNQDGMVWDVDVACSLEIATETVVLIMRSRFEVHISPIFLDVS